MQFKKLHSNKGLKMKKLLVLATLGAMSASAFAAPVGETFTGVGVSADLTTAKYKVNGVTGKQSTGPVLVVDYGMDQGNNLIGVAQAKTKFGSTKVTGDVKQKNKYTIGYQQGYRIGSDLLPYAKVEASLSKVGNSTFHGFGYGVGAKYAISTNIEMGTEYTRNNLKCGGTRLKGNDFSANFGYRF